MAYDRDMLIALDAPLAIEARPYASMAAGLGMTERELLSTLRALRKAGVVRRVGAVLAPAKVGFAANALVAWRVAGARRDAVAKRLARFPEVTHCYARTPRRGWPYTLYTMVHAATRAACRSLIARMAEKVRIADYRVLFTVKELKKEKTHLAEILS